MSVVVVAYALFCINSLRASEVPVVNINTATEEQLAYLPGVGPSKASNITYAREQGMSFESVDDLRYVSGFGPVTIEKCRPFVVVTGETTATREVIYSEDDEEITKYKRPTRE